ncbi:amidase family protein [Micromonospora sp. WMMD964]|uniref:amidase n=1 Tax=Micromonospora sp. WMMD964 TaxID=3016091 RepID=UPI00249AE9F3|nr:amidase family protein [Micromonospora sp. WMMD964]WFE98636.1 amidase family protein [Micromonospora sp. WMMD964]
MADELVYADITALRGLFGRKAVSPVEYVTDVLGRIEEADLAIGAFVTVDRDGALLAASLAEQTLRTEGPAAFRRLPLLGMAISIKDLIPTRGLRTTRGSLLHRDWVPDFDPPLVRRLREAGAVIVGKTNTPEFGWSGASGNRVVGRTRNPWVRDRTPGGSSAGAGAAVAAGFGVGSVGTDGAGSIRIPASFCGVVGFKPSFSRIPYVPASAELLSHAGPLTRTVADAALMYRAMAGPDPLDPWSLPVEQAEAGTAPLRIAWVRTLGAPAPDPQVEKACAAAVAVLAAAGHEVVETDWPFEDPYPILATILAVADAAGHDEAADTLIDPGRRPIIEYGRGISGTDHAEAIRLRGDYTGRVLRWMADYDVLATPTVPGQPFPVALDQPTDTPVKGPAPWLAWTPATYPANLTGQPAISVPVGRTAEGCPVGLQLVGRWRADESVLRIAGHLEQLQPWRDMYDDLAGGY